MNVNVLKWVPCDLPPEKLYSPASIGKGTLRKIGITKPMKNSIKNFDSDTIGAIISTYYGRRTEINHRAKPCKVRYCDFKSMYPTVNTLMGLWKFLICEEIECEDATEEVKGLIDNVVLDDLQNPEFWEKLRCIVQIKPEDDLLPVRANYQKMHNSKLQNDQNIGLNYLWSTTPLWYALPDLILSRLLTGKTPKIIKAYKFIPKGIVSNLNEIDLFGFVFNPVKDDLFKEIIKHRTALKRKRDTHPETSFEYNDLDLKQNILKIIANSSSYGIFVEMNEEENTTEKEIFVHTGIEPVFSEKRKIWDRTGAFFNPINSTLITSASRLMLGLVEALSNRLDLEHAFCDTDSMALIVEDEEDEAKVKEIVDWFIPLNPYDEEKTIFEYEDDNYDNNGVLRDLWFYGISSKRYCLYTIGSDRSIVLVKPSAHGFGQYMDVIDNDEEIEPIKKMFKKERSSKEVGFEEMGLFEKIWSLYLNYFYGNISKDMVNKILDGKPMIKPFTISSYNLYNAFEALNKNKDWFNKYKPFSFMVVGNEINKTCDNFGFRLSENEQNVLPIAPYHTKERWKEVIEKSFINKKTGSILQGKEFWGVSGSFNKHFWTYFEDHPEFKFKNCKDSGFLRRRFITPNERIYHTKEMKKMEEVNTGLLSFQNSIERYSPPQREKKESTVEVFEIELSKSDFKKLQRGTQKYLKALGWRDYHSKGVVIKEDSLSKTGFKEKDVDFNGHPCYMSKQTFHNVKSENTLPNKETIEKAVFDLLFTMLLPEEIPYFENYSHLNTIIIIERLIEIGGE